MTARGAAQALPTLDIRITPFDSPVAQHLVHALYEEQLGRYGHADAPNEPASDYEPPDGVFLVAYDNDQPIACGGYRPHEHATVEIRRLYVISLRRRRGIGQRIVELLERNARAAGMTHVVLETGVRNAAALRLFSRQNYRPISSYHANRDPNINRAFMLRLRSK